jgi:hypothetical protein
LPTRWRHYGRTPGEAQPSPGFGRAWLLADALDGVDADQTVQFDLIVVIYEIDLSEDNAANPKLCAPVGLSTPVGGSAAGAARTKCAAATNTKPDLEQLKAICVWAKDNGRQVCDRGRISADIAAACDAARWRS